VVVGAAPTRRRRTSPNGDETDFDAVLPSLDDAALARDWLPADDPWRNRIGRQRVL
jgi:hypothetical protein